jgi:hypothetical protein
MCIFFLKILVCVLDIHIKKEGFSALKKEEKIIN